MVELPPATADDIRLHLLVLRCQTGDEAAFSRLFDEFGPRTLAHLRGLVRDGADDVQQEVWLTVYRSLRGLSNPGAFRTWLFRTTRHRAIDFLRKRKREAELADDLATMTVEAVEPATDEESLAMDETQLEAAMQEMPLLQREALLLRYRDGMSYAQIALVVGCPVGTVRTRLHYAKRHLQTRLTRGTS